MSADELIDAWQAAWAAPVGRATADAQPARVTERFAALATVDLQYEDPLTPRPLLGAHALAEHAATLWQAFPDLRLERSGRRLSDGRYLAAPCRLVGSHRGPLIGLPPTGRALSLQVIFYCELQRDRLRRVRAFFDAYGAAVQLGLLPARGTLGERALLLLRGFGLRAIGRG